MELVSDEVVVEKFGIAIRVIKDDGMYVVQQAPISQDGTYNSDDFSVFGGTVGYDTSEFNDKDDAHKFFNDIQRLNNKELAKLYASKWVEIKT